MSNDFIFKVLKNVGVREARKDTIGTRKETVAREFTVTSTVKR